MEAQRATSVMMNNAFAKKIELFMFLCTEQRVCFPLSETIVNRLVFFGGEMSVELMMCAHLY